MQSAVQHQRLDHVARHIGPSQRPGDARAALPAPEQDEVADAGAAAGAAVERHPRAALENGLRHDKPAALLQNRDARDLQPAAARGSPRRRAHLPLETRDSSTRSAVGSASSRGVCESSRARTAGTMPLCARFTPLGR